MERFDYYRYFEKWFAENNITFKYHWIEYHSPKDSKLMGNLCSEVFASLEFVSVDISEEDLCLFILKFGDRSNDSFRIGE